MARHADDLDTQELIKIHNAVLSDVIDSSTDQATEMQNETDAVYLHRYQAASHPQLTTDASIEKQQIENIENLAGDITHESTVSGVTHARNQTTNTEAPITSNKRIRRSARNIGGRPKSSHEAGDAAKPANRMAANGEGLPMSYDASASPTQENDPWVYEARATVKSGSQLANTSASQDLSLKTTIETGRTYGDSDTGRIEIDLEQNITAHDSTNPALSQASSTDSEEQSVIPLPKTPHHTNPFNNRGSVLAASQLFGATQTSPFTAGRATSATSARPTPVIHGLQKSPSKTISSPLDRTGKQEMQSRETLHQLNFQSSSPVSLPDLTTGGISQEIIPRSTSVDGVITRSSSKLTPSAAQRWGPIDMYESRKDSQERKRKVQDVRHRVESDGSDDDFGRSAQVSRKKKNKRKAANRELKAVEARSRLSSAKADFPLSSTNIQRLSGTQENLDKCEGDTLRAMQEGEAGIEIVYDSQTEVVNKHTDKPATSPLSSPLTTAPPSSSNLKLPSMEPQANVAEQVPGLEHGLETETSSSAPGTKILHVSRCSSQILKEVGPSKYNLQSPQTTLKSTSFSEDTTVPETSPVASSHPLFADMGLHSSIAAASINEIDIPGFSPDEAFNALVSDRSPSKSLGYERRNKAQRRTSGRSTQRNESLEVSNNYSSAAVNSESVELKPTGSSAQFSSQIRQVSGELSAPSTPSQAVNEKTIAGQDGPSRRLEIMESATAEPQVRVPLLRRSLSKSTSEARATESKGHERKTPSKSINTRTSFRGPVRSSRRLTALSIACRTFSDTEEITTPKSVNSKEPRKLKSKIFGTMAFAVSYSKGEEERRNMIALITDNGGCVLESGFEELFGKDSSTLLTPTDRVENPSVQQENSLKPNTKALKTGFVALIADKHSRRAKYMQALALGVPCLSGKWIINCISKSSVLSFAPYQLCAGESTFLDGALHGGNIIPYDAAKSSFSTTFENRRKLLDGKSILLIMGKSKTEENKRKAYAFLTFALGAARVGRVATAIDARQALLEAESREEPWDWVYTGSGEEQAKTDIFGSEDVKVAKKRRKSSSKSLGEDEVGGARPRRIKVVSDEFVIQSLIVGMLIDEL